MGTLIGLSTFLATSIDSSLNKAAWHAKLFIVALTLPFLIILATLWAACILFEGAKAIYNFIKQIVIAYKNA